MAIFLLGGLLTVLHAVPTLAEKELSPSSIRKGVLLVASPSLEDPNFRQAVVLVVEHGPGGTVCLILNRSTKVLLSEALPELTILKGDQLPAVCRWAGRADPISPAVPTQGASSGRTIGLRRGLSGAYARSS